MISAIDGRYELEDAEQAGANVFVVKPFNLLRVLNLMEDVAAQIIRADSRLFVIRSTSG